jgi:hypothetical protein
MECQRTAMGTVYCEEHVPATAAAPPPASPYASPYSGPTAPPVSPVVSNISPGLAFVLGLIPGVGAIYNGQYAKGLVHVVVFGLLISIINSPAGGGLEPLFGMLIPAWIFYMAFEAFHTAKRRQLGETVDEFSSLMPLKAQGGGFPVAPIVLIAIGILFLLHNLEIIRLYQLLRYWPVFLIVLGAYMLYVRVTDGTAPVVNREATNEHQ